MAPSSSKQLDAYDYIILGGGTAGLTIAARLSEEPYLTVAVIEAGKNWNPISGLISSIPGTDVLFVGTREKFPGIDWEFQTPADPASGNKKRGYARGKCLGGSSARGFMIYQRPSRGALDSWAEVVGDPSYSFDRFLPHYKRSVNFTAPDETREVCTHYDSRAFNSGGAPLNVSYPTYGQPFSEHVKGSLNQIGIPTISDFNSGVMMGCQYTSCTINPKNGKRESAATSFLKEARRQNRPNLHIFTSTMAKKILFDEKMRAVEVVVERKGIERTLRVSKEVIVSAGAFQSPQILMVSGIGPSSHLHEHGIPVLVDLPGVGQNLQDHIFFGPTYKVDVKTFTSLATNPITLVKETFNFFAHKRGPLTNPIADLIGWEKIPSPQRNSMGQEALEDLSKYPADWPEVGYISSAGYVGDWSSLLFKQPRDSFQYGTILAALETPLSRGNIQLTSNTTSDLPIINMAYLTHPTDQAVAIAAFKRTRNAFGTEHMRGILKGVESYPGLDVSSDEDILDAVKKSLQTVWHASCTCKMGKDDDPMSVLDSGCKVRGVEGVRVVDTSSFPFLPPGHPQSTVYALAEKIADVIKNGA